MPKFTLHTYWRSSSSYRVRIALLYKGLPHEQVFVNLLEGEQKKPEYLATSPTGFVPCLDIDGTPYVESVAIIEMLEELFPDPPLLPRRPEERARVRALVQIINAGTQPLQNLSVLARVSSEQEARVAWMKHFITRGLGAFEALVARFDKERGFGGPFACGSSFTMADAFLVPQVYAARRYGVDLTPYSRVARADAAALALPFVADARPEAQPDAKPSATLKPSPVK